MAVNCRSWIADPVWNELPYIFNKIDDDKRKIDEEKVKIEEEKRGIEQEKKNGKTSLEARKNLDEQKKTLETRKRSLIKMKKNLDTEKRRDGIVEGIKFTKKTLLKLKADTACINCASDILTYVKSEGDAHGTYRSFQMSKRSDDLIIFAKRKHSTITGSRK
jgi:hypothetical protein